MSAEGPNGTATKKVSLSAAEAPEQTAGSITLASIATKELGVVSTGQTEQSQLTFQVTDSTGNPLSSANSTEISLRLADDSPAGAKISPQTATTDENGQVSPTLTSGTDAGVAQVIAETSINGSTITSKPVAVTIHAGLP
ncbi:MAG: invasin domain 3-containing protein [Fodinibius sp.]|nr:invasin domain 3-containing protein [Fodinibius sp.]